MGCLEPPLIPVQYFFANILYMNKIILTLLLLISLSRFTMAQSDNSETSQSLPGGEIRRGVFLPTNAHDSAVWQEQRRKQQLLQIEPTGKPEPSHIQIYIDRYKKMAVYDPRVLCFNIKASYQNGKITLQGMVSLEEQKVGLMQMMDILHFTPLLIDKVEVLPATSLGQERYAIAKSSHVLYYSHPYGAREKLTESMLGDRIFLLKEDTENGYYYAQHSNGYLGWIKKDDVLRVGLPEFQKWRRGKRAVFQRNYISQDSSLYIPIGADLPIQDNGMILIPGKDPASVPSEYVVIYDCNPTPIALRMLDNAKEFLGVKYVWGGVQNQGVDCSGFVNSMYRSIGIILSRDADQQFLAGEITGWRGFIEDMLPGDLLYFAAPNGRISHTGIYVGDGKFIHAQEPVVRYSSFRPTDPEYDQKTVAKFVFAKRVLRMIPQITEK